MRKAALGVATLVLVLGASRAEAGFWDTITGWFKSKPAAVTRHARIRVRYTVDPKDDGDVNGTFGARGVRVGVSTHTNLFGAASIDAAAETDANGRVTLSYPVRPGEKVTFRFETDGGKAKTYKGTGNFWDTPHRGKLELSEADSQKDVDKDLRWDGLMNEALGVQSAATHARAYGERVMGSDFRDKVDYEFPCSDPKGENKDISHTSSPSHVSVCAPAWGRAHHTIFHETGHTFYLKARGRFAELLSKVFYSKNSSGGHSFGAPIGDTRWAFSEGIADFFMVAAKDEFGRATGRGDLVTHQCLDWCGEYHLGRDHRDIDFVKFGNDSEVNVANGLWDLIDLADDEDGIVAGFKDRSHLGTFDQGLKALFVAVDDVGGIERPDMGKMWRDSDGYHKKFGAAGENALRMNGLDPSK